MNWKNAVATYKKSGNHFFDQDTIKFWGTRLYPGSFKKDYFVTGEDNFNRTKVRYTVRKFINNYTDIKVIGDFQEYETYDDALYALLKTLEKENA